jgi:hypothetical protein
MPTKEAIVALTSREEVIYNHLVCTRFHSRANFCGVRNEGWRKSLAFFRFRLRNYALF